MTVVVPLDGRKANVSIIKKGSKSLPNYRNEEVLFVVLFWEQDFSAARIHSPVLQPIGCMCRLNTNFPTILFKRS